MSKFSRIIMFLSSYIPLYIILFILNINVKGIFSSMKYFYFNGLSLKHIYYILTTWNLSDLLEFLLLTLTVVSYVLLKRVIKISRMFSESIYLEEMCEKNNVLLDYLLVYIVSFVNSSFSDFSKNDIRSFLAFIIMFLTLGYLYIVNKMFYINPVLHLKFHFNIYSVKTNSSSIIILSKKTEFEFKKILKQKVSLYHVDSNIYILDKDKS